MGSIGTLFAATLVAVTYGWVPASAEDQEKGNQEKPTANGYEYLVQVGAEDLRALTEGRVSSLSSATPEGMKSIERVRIVFGEGELPRQLTAVDRTSPQRIASQSQGAQRHTVAKPVVSDWLPARSELAPNATPEKQEGVRHTVYQRPGYQEPGSLGEAMQRGFQEGTRQVTDAIRNAPQNLENYANQAGRDLAEGTRGIVGSAFDGLGNTIRAGATGIGNVANDTLNVGNDPYFRQRQQERNTTAPPNRMGPHQPGFTPFSYNEPQPTGPTNPQTQPAQFSQPNAQDSRTGLNHPQSTHQNQQAAPNRSSNQGPAFPADTRQNRADGGIATTFGSGASNDRGYDNQSSNGRGYENHSYNNNGRSQYSDPYNEGRLTPVARNEQEQRQSQNDPFYDQDYPRRGPLDEFGTRGEEPRRTEYNDWRTQTVDNRPAAPAFGTPSNTWDTLPANTQPQRTQMAGFATPAQSQQGQNQQGTSGDVRSWSDMATNPQQNNGQYVQQNGVNTGSQNAPLSNTPNGLLFSLLLAGSLAGNLYIVTSYLDVRNKYRSALRSGPGGYHQHTA